LYFAKPIIPNFLGAGIFVIIASMIYFAVLLKLNFYIEEDLRILEFVSEKTPIFKTEIIKFRKYLSKFVNKSYKEI